jgi:uncharacterized cupredoxin-like copper-binding protein
MATTTQEPSTPTVEQELHELEDSNDALDQRTGNLEMRGGLAVLFAFFAIAVSLAALTVSFISSGKSSTKTVVQRAPAATAPAAPAATAPGTVAVKLGEMFVRPNATTVAAGKVTFQVQNTGKLVHEMIVSKAPVAFPSGAAKASEKTSVGEVAELQPGTSGQTKLNLTPGTYVLYCNVPGHYAAGQHIAFTVTK